MSDIELVTLEPFEIDPLVLAEHLHAETPWWRPLRRRRLSREARRLRQLKVASRSHPAGEARG